MYLPMSSDTSSIKRCSRSLRTPVIIAGALSSWVIFFDPLPVLCPGHAVPVIHHLGQRRVAEWSRPDQQQCEDCSRDPDYPHLTVSLFLLPIVYTSSLGGSGTISVPQGQVGVPMSSHF